jgi:glycosyltransferase involved in cell wall biosynthesis
MDIKPDPGPIPKLLVVIGTLDHMGGAERQALYLVEHLAGLKGCTVEVLTFHDGENLRHPLRNLGVAVHVCPYYFRWPRARRTRALARLAWQLRFKIKPDAILPFVGIHSKAVAQAWGYTRARFCWWNQQDEGRDLNGTPVEAKILRKVSAITSNSFAGRDVLARTYGLAPESILVYNNGTPILKPVDAQPLRSRLRIGRRPVVSMIANVTSFKDHSTLIEAWAIVRNHFSEDESPVLLLAGSLSETATVARLQVQTFNLGLSSSKVKFLGAVDDIVEVISASDLVVHSSTTEGCPNAVCEAMALSRPVVATDIPGSRQALGDDAVESLAPERDPVTLAHRIIRLLEDDELRATIGHRNRERIQSQFSIETMNVFFQELIEKHLGVSLA